MKEKGRLSKKTLILIGVFVVVLFLKPVLEFFTLDSPTRIYEVFDSFNRQIEQLDLKLEEGETIYEYFFFKGKGE